MEVSQGNGGSSLSRNDSFPSLSVDHSATTVLENKRNKPDKNHIVTGRFDNTKNGVTNAVISEQNGGSFHESHEVRNSLIAGSIAGMTSCTLFHPLDVIRTKMQATTKLKGAETAANISKQFVSGISSSKAFRSTSSGINASSGPLAFFSHTIQNGGLRAIYTGFSFPLAAQACYKSTIFTVNRLSHNFIIDTRSKEHLRTGGCAPYQLTVFDHFICGVLSGSVNALLFVSPVEYIRSQLIHQHTHIAQGKKMKDVVMNGPMDVIKTTLKRDGIFGLWRGAGVTLARDSVGCGSFFVCYELGKKYLPIITQVEPSSQIHMIGAGMMAGIGYWAMSLPLDALKTLVQTGKAHSALDTLSLLMNRDGIVKTASQLYRGWQLAFGRGAPSAAVTLMTYSTVYDFCKTKII